MNTSIMNPTTTLTRTGVISSFAPRLSRIVMLPPILVFTLIGIRFLTNPGHATPGVTLSTPEAFTDTRALGAWMVTMVIMLIVFLLSQNRLWLGNLLLVVFMGATLAVRIFGFINDGTTLAMGNQRTITIAETIFLVLNTMGLVLQTQLFRKSR